METLLLNFDIDCCCVAFRVGGSSVFATERFMRALQFGVNVFDTDFYSKSYCRRLEKYAGRGIAVGMPGLDRNRVCAMIAHGSYVYVSKYDMLFRVEHSVPHGRKMQVRGKTIPKVEATQRATVVRGVERLLIQSDRNCFLRHVDVPCVWLCPEHACLNAEDARRSGACVAVSTGVRDAFLLLWGAGDDDSDTEGSQDEDSTGYETAPLASVYKILEQYLAIDNSSQGDDAWFAGDNRS